MHEFEVVVKRDDKELFSFEISQVELDIAKRLGISMNEFIKQKAKLKAEELKNANLSNSK